MLLQFWPGKVHAAVVWRLAAQGFRVQPKYRSRAVQLHPLAASGNTQQVLVGVVVQAGPAAVAAEPEVCGVEGLVVEDGGGGDVWQQLREGCAACIRTHSGTEGQYSFKEGGMW